MRSVTRLARRRRKSKTNLDLTRHPYIVELLLSNSCLLVLCCPCEGWNAADWPVVLAAALSEDVPTGATVRRLLVLVGSISFVAVGIVSTSLVAP